MDIRSRTMVNIPDPDGTGHRIVGFRIRDEGGLSEQLEAFDKVLKLDGDRRYAAGLEAAVKVAEDEPEPGQPTEEQYQTLIAGGRESIVELANATTRATKKNIAKAIRALGKEE